MIQNKYKVQDEQWQKFSSDLAKATYNEVMDKSLHSQDLHKDPKAKSMPQGHWETVCHNLAALAAYRVGNNPVDGVVDGDKVEEFEK